MWINRQFICIFYFCNNWHLCNLNCLGKNIKWSSIPHSLLLRLYYSTTTTLGFRNYVPNYVQIFFLVAAIEIAAGVLDLFRMLHVEPLNPVALIYCKICLGPHSIFHLTLESASLDEYCVCAGVGVI